MIRSLRSRHRLLWIVLALGLPTGLALALSARESMPRTTPVGAILTDSDVPREGFVDAFEVEAVSTRVRTRPGSPIWIECTPIAELAAPDVLVYWSAEGEVGPGAVLCGSLSDRVERMRLPEAAQDGGSLVFYSTPRAETLAVQPLGGE